MAKKALQQAALLVLQQSHQALTIDAISSQLNHEVADRTLRRWLAQWVERGELIRTGAGRATRYQYPDRYWLDSSDSVLQVREPKDIIDKPRPPGFLQGLDSDLQTALLGQLRDLWTHSSTALEGNTLSLGDTHFILQEGLTISGKPVKDHKEVIGHAQAIDVLYRCLDAPLTETVIFDLHRAVQTELVYDIYRPIGNWKNEINGTYAIDKSGKQIFIEYALPQAVPVLMAELIELINTADAIAAPVEVYAKVHMGVAHIHPFFDGNGRIARLLANIPLLKAGLPPLIIPQQQRRAYIQVLADYQIEVGQLNQRSGVWPQPELLTEFTAFCTSCYAATQALVEQASEHQAGRVKRNC